MSKNRATAQADHSGVTGTPAAYTLVTQDASTLQVAAEALHIPDHFEVSVQDATAGTQILAKQVELPAGVELHSDPDVLVVNVVTAPTEEEMAGEVEEACRRAGMDDDALLQIDDDGGSYQALASRQPGDRPPAFAGKGSDASVISESSRARSN